MVGPEGGWANEELDKIIASVSSQAVDALIWRVSLGEGILRAETASIYALSAWNAFCCSTRGSTS